MFGVFFVEPPEILVVREVGIMEVELHLRIEDNRREFKMKTSQFACSTCEGLVGSVGTVAWDVIG